MLHLFTLKHPCFPYLPWHPVTSPTTKPICPNNLKICSRGTLHEIVSDLLFFLPPLTLLILKASVTVMPHSLEEDLRGKNVHRQNKDVCNHVPLSLAFLDNLNLQLRKVPLSFGKSNFSINGYVEEFYKQMHAHIRG